MEKVALSYYSTAKSIFKKRKKKKDNKSNFQSFGRMIKYFVQFSPADNFHDKEVIWSQKIFQNQ